MLTGEVCSHDIPEVAKMISKKLIDYGMRCMSICIAVTIFILSAQSKLPIPKTVSFHGLDKLLHACAFGSLAFTLSYWFVADKWLTKPFRYSIGILILGGARMNTAIIEKLTAFFDAKPEIILAMLYGSCSRGTEIDKSDVDIKKTAEYFLS